MDWTLHIFSLFRRNLPKLKEVYVIRNSERIDLIMFENREIKFAKVPCKFRQTSEDVRKHVITVSSGIFPRNPGRFD